MYENVGESQYMDSDELCRRIQEMEKYVAACLQELDMRVSQQLTLLLPPPLASAVTQMYAEPNPNRYLMIQMTMRRRRRGRRTRTRTPMAEQTSKTT